MKTRSIRLLKQGALIGAAMLLTGCLYMTEGTKLPPITPVPASSYQPMIEHTVGDFAFTLEGGKMVTSNFAGKMLSENILNAWKDRHYIRDCQDPPDYLQKRAWRLFESRIILQAVFNKTTS